MIPGDDYWPASLSDLGERAPYLLWTRGASSFLARPLADLVTITGARATTSYGEHVAGTLAYHEFDRLMAAETDELARLTANRDRLEGEQDRLMQAHYADAIPLTVLKREQDRITGELDKVTRRIDAHYGDYADARAHLDDALGLLANCADIYTRCDDTNRRLCNQAFFTKVFIDEDNELRAEHNRPFEMLLDPQVNANALTWAADANKARTSTNIDVGKGSSLVRGVDPVDHYGNRRQRVERLVSAWSKGSGQDTALSGAPDDPLIGVSAEPRRRPRTRLTDEEVDAMRTASAQGVSVTALARQFGVHRGTVWVKTRPA